MDVLLIVLSLIAAYVVFVSVGYLLIRLLFPKIEVEDPKGYVWQEGASVVSEALVKGIEPRIAAEHALHVLEVIEAARKSQETGTRIKLKSKFPWPIVK